MKKLLVQRTNNNSWDTTIANTRYPNLTHLATLKFIVPSGFDDLASELAIRT